MESTWGDENHYKTSGVVQISTKRPKNCLKNVPIIEKL
jgi:hypothetical protein